MTTDPLTLLSREGSVSGLTWDEARRLKRRGQARGWISVIRPEGEDRYTVERIGTSQEVVEADG